MKKKKKQIKINTLLEINQLKLGARARQRHQTLLLEGKTGSHSGGWCAGFPAQRLPLPTGKPLGGSLTAALHKGFWLQLHLAPLRSLQS